MSTGAKNKKRGEYISFFLFFVGLLIGLLDYLYLGKYYALIVILSFAMLAASIGMFWNKYKRLSKYLSVILMSAAGLSLYVSTDQIFYAVISLAFILMVIVEEMILTQQKRGG